MYRLVDVYGGSGRELQVVEKILCMDWDLFQSKGYGLFGYRQVVEFGNILVMFDYAGNITSDMGASLSGNGCRTF